jgi:HEPN domain-containing protein
MTREVSELPIKVSDRGLEISRWFQWGDRDYIAARQLLIGGLLVQGTSLATTAVEKYLKGAFVHADLKVPRSHNPLELFEEFEKIGSLNLNKAFLSTITKAYKLRYPDDLPRGYNIALNQALLLTHLDETVFAILSRFQIHNKDGKAIPLLFEASVASNDRRVLDGNCALEPKLKESLLASPSLCMDFHLLMTGDVLEAHYKTARVDPSSSVERAGMVQKSDKEFGLAYLPITADEKK